MPRTRTCPNLATFSPFDPNLVGLTPTWGIFWLYAFLCFWGGMLTGLIGVGIEKLVFVLATWGKSTIHVRRSSSGGGWGW